MKRSRIVTETSVPFFHQRRNFIEVLMYLKIIMDLLRGLLRSIQENSGHSPFKDPKTVPVVAAPPSWPKSQKHHYSTDKHRHSIGSAVGTGTFCRTPSVYGRLVRAGATIFSRLAVVADAAGSAGILGMSEWFRKCPSAARLSGAFRQQWRGFRESLSASRVGRLTYYPAALPHLEHALLL
ncbi:hypothetical protein J6590_006201 [Homalodisca vitripennis]|nr:hypothetical protein J6590_006201 [Homalodisca vitripennis]